MNPRTHSPLRFLPALVILGVAGVWAWRENKRGLELARELAALRPLAEDAEALARKASAEPPANPDTNELRRLQSEHLELLRLRNEITGLNRHADLSPETLRQRIQESASRTDAARKATLVIEERTRAKDLADETVQALSHSIFHLTEALKRTSGPVPVSWNDVRRIFESAVAGAGAAAPSVQANLQALIENLDAAQQESVKPSDFEFVPVPATYRHDPAGAPPHLLILRERKPRRMPDGGWSRAYGFLDGTADMATSPDGDFSAWELAAGKSTGLVPPP